MDRITLLSPAKLNLTLEVLGKRADGYHDIRSIMVPVNLFDEVTVELVDEGAEGSSDIEVETEGLELEKPEDNLAWKAARLFIDETGIKGAIKIRVKKNIPEGGGLGGGSSNAAAVLTGLSRLTRKLTEEELIELSPRLGADVPFFVHSRPSLVEGIGEKITLIHDFPRLHFVLLNPGFSVPTKGVFEQFDVLQPQERQAVDVEGAIEGFKRGEFLLCNHLEQAATALNPEIESLRALLEGFEVGGVSLSGTGPTVFGALASEDEARAVYGYLKDSTTLGVFIAESIAGWHRL